MKWRTLLVGWLALPALLFSGIKTVEVDFLKTLGLQVNGAGPILVRVDAARNRIILVHTYTSSVSVIDGSTHAVRNIPIAGRIPQYLKNEALAIDNRTGNIYLVGTRQVHVVFPEENRALSLATDKQFEVVSVDESTGNAFFTGREDRRLGFLDLAKKKLRFIPLFDREETLINLNATPPPAIRKVVCDTVLHRVVVLDGYERTLFTLSSSTRKVLSQRVLPTRDGTRWHFAGYDPASHFLYLAIETDRRVVVEAAKIDVLGTRDVIVPLPPLTEGVGVTFHPGREEVIIPYDNHPVVVVVDFRHGGEISWIDVPAFGNDAAALDIENAVVYLASWAYGEIDVLDLASRCLSCRVKDIGVLPHMFAIAYNPNNRKLYIPLGATAVNGSFGAAVTAFDTQTFQAVKIRTGWSPVDLTALPGTDRFLVFDSEDGFADVAPDGSFRTELLPCLYPRTSLTGPNKTVFLSYGPHQSYWPTVYIWAAKNGILEIEPRPFIAAGEERMNFQMFDCRIARLAHRMSFTADGKLFALQNSWGREKQFLLGFDQGIRLFSSERRVVFEEEIERETIPRILKYDASTRRLAVVKIGEKDDEPGMCHFVDAGDTSKVLGIARTGLTPTDLVFGKTWAAVSNFDSRSITMIDNKTYRTWTVPTGKSPLKLAVLDTVLYVLNHRDNTLQEIGPRTSDFKLPVSGLPDNLVAIGDSLIVTSHSPDRLWILSFDPKQRTFRILVEREYPYGDTAFDTGNSAFYMRGQFGDGLFEITRICADEEGRLWITDFLSGRLFILDSL